MRKTSVIALVIGLAGLLAVSAASADTAEEINSNVNASLKLFERVKGGGSIIKKAAGLLVFPKVYKAGLGIGGEYGEGALRIGRKTVDYYSTTAASIGLQLGVQKKTIIVAFMDKRALKEFRKKSGWKVGVDASVAVIAVGAGGAIDSASINDPGARSMVPRSRPVVRHSRSPFSGFRARSSLELCT